uniref:Uncharacterized protein n=1 Tax=Kalanchoe fedtschenkoi TaxID=63787 RepID=A0A7N0TIF2_KALFE
MGCCEAVCSEISVPFSWEVKPGISKHSQEHVVFTTSTSDMMELPLPPCLQDKPRMSLQESPVSIPDGFVLPCSWDKPRMSVPGAFQQSWIRMRSSSRKGLWRKEADPFEAARKECTKATTLSPWRKLLTKSRSAGGRQTNKRSFFDFSCKHSCNAREDSIFRL